MIESRSWNNCRQRPGAEGGVLAEALKRGGQRRGHHGRDRTAREHRQRDRHGDLEVTPADQCEREEGPPITMPMTRPVSNSRRSTERTVTPCRERPDQHRLCLGADRVSHVDHGGDEEGEQHVGLELLLEASDDRGRGHRPEQPNQQPGQPMPEALRDRLLGGAARACRFRPDSRPGAQDPLRARRAERAASGKAGSAPGTCRRRRPPPGCIRGAPPFPGRRAPAPVGPGGCNETVECALTCPRLPAHRRAAGRTDGRPASTAA